ncbi:MAG: hypothetical protein OXU75_14520 [Deltaproteobacteria bacterium]|nr:hypothetical protein [Deltaproteobacteria bacterium]
MAFRVIIEGTTERPTVRVEGEVREDANWGAIRTKFGRDENWMRDRLRANWADKNGRSVVRPKSIYTADKSEWGWPWNDQSYSRYGLRPVQLFQRAVRSRIVKETSEPYAAIVDEWINHSDTPTEYGGALDYELQNTIESNWSASATIGVSTTVGVEVGGDVYGGKASLSQTMSLETSFGVGGSKSQAETISLGRSISKTVGPHKGASPRITATKGSLIVLVDYVLSLEGHLWIDFGRRQEVGNRGSHFFYFEDVKNHIGRTIEMQQTIPINFYHGARMEMRDIPDPYDGAMQAD